MSVQYPAGKVEISYAVYSDSANFGQNGAGIPLGRLEAKLVEIRGYHINWLSYFQNEVISKDDYELICKLDQLNPMQRNVALTKDSGKSLSTLISLWGCFKKDQALKYTLVMTDDIITEDKSRVKAFHDVANQDDVSIWKPLFNLLNRDDPIILQMASRIIAKLACWSRVKCPVADLSLYLGWLKGQLVIHGNEYLQNIAECLQWMMRVEDYRKPFLRVDGINRDFGGFLEAALLWIHPILQNLCRTQWARVGNSIDYRDSSIVSVLLSNVGFQLQYQLIFSLWMLSFNADIADKICENNVIPVLVDIIRNSQKEKVTRIILATLRNLLQKPEEPKLAAVSMIQCKILPVISILNNKNWDDEDIKEDVEFLLEKLNDGVQDLSTFDEYVAEVKSGRLEWSPVHKSDKFWRENAIRLTDNNYELLRILVRLLESSVDPLILAVACHDLGEFVRLYPRGKPAFDALGGKEFIMLRMTHEDPQVRYEALLAVQKLMVHNWEFLGKQLKAEK